MNKLCSKLSASVDNNSSRCYVSEVLYENRYCDQEDFSVLVCGGETKNKKYSNHVFEVKLPTFKVSKCASMVKPRFRPELVVVNSDVMAIGGDVDSNN